MMATGVARPTWDTARPEVNRDCAFRKSCQGQHQPIGNTVHKSTLIRGSVQSTTVYMIR